MDSDDTSEEHKLLVQTYPALIFEKAVIKAAGVMSDKTLKR
jgi:hypothetical protein